MGQICHCVHMDSHMSLKFKLCYKDPRFPFKKKKISVSPSILPVHEWHWMLTLMVHTVVLNECVCLVHDPQDDGCTHMGAELRTSNYALKNSEVAKCDSYLYIKEIRSSHSVWIRRKCFVIEESITISKHWPHELPSKVLSQSWHMVSHVDKTVDITKIRNYYPVLFSGWAYFSRYSMMLLFSHLLHWDVGLICNVMAPESTKKFTFMDFCHYNLKRPMAQIFCLFQLGDSRRNLTCFAHDLHTVQQMVDQSDWCRIESIARNFPAPLRNLDCETSWVTGPRRQSESWPRGQLPNVSNRAMKPSCIGLFLEPVRGLYTEPRRDKLW